MKILISIIIGLALILSSCASMPKLPLGSCHLNDLNVYFTGSVEQSTEICTKHGLRVPMYSFAWGCYVPSSNLIICFDMHNCGHELRHACGMDEGLHDYDWRAIEGRK